MENVSNVVVFDESDLSGAVAKFKITEKINGEMMYKMLKNQSTVDEMVESVKEFDVGGFSGIAKIDKRRKLNPPTVKLFDSLKMLMSSGEAWDRRGSTWSREVVYNTAARYGLMPIGRLYAASSTQSLPKLIRSTLFKGISRSIDIVDCHYTLLDQFCEKYGIALPSLHDHVKNRTDERDQIESSTGLLASSPAVKKLFLGILFGMSIDTWKHENGIDGDLPEFIDHLVGDLEKFRTILTKDMGKFCFNNQSNDATFSKKSQWEREIANMSSLLYTIEARIMTTMAKYALTVGRSVTQLLHDSIEVGLADDSDEKMLSDDDLKPALEAKVLETTGYVIRLAWKDHVDVLSVSPSIDGDGTAESWTGSGYQAKKEKFELTTFKTMCPVAFWTFHESDGKYHVCGSERELKEKFRNINFDAIDEKTGKLSSKSFVDAWLRDGGMRSYERTVLIPTTEPTDVKLFNLWRGFAVQHFSVSDDDLLDQTVIDDVAFLADHLGQISENDDHRRWFENLFAHLFQFPMTRPRVCSVFQSDQQGTGKGLEYQLLRKMIGSDYCFMTANSANDVLGTFNGGIENKLLILLDEARIFKDEQMQMFKSHITEPTFSCRKMRTDAYETETFSRFLVFTNRPNAMPLEENERRFHISSSSRNPPSTEYINRLIKCIGDDRVVVGYYHYLMRIPMNANFPFHETRPASSLYSQIRESTTQPEIRFFVNFIFDSMIDRDASILDGQLPNTGALISSSSSTKKRQLFRFTVSSMYAEYKKYMTDNGFVHIKEGQQLSFCIGHYFQPLNHNGITKLKPSLNVYSWEIETERLVRCFETKGLINRESLDDFLSHSPSSSSSSSSLSSSPSSSSSSSYGASSKSFIVKH